MKTFKQYIKEVKYGPNDPVSPNVLDIRNNKGRDAGRHDTDNIRLNSTLLNKSSDKTNGEVTPPKRSPLKPPRETVIMKGERN